MFYTLAIAFYNSTGAKAKYKNCQYTQQQESFHKVFLRLKGYSYQRRIEIGTIRKKGNGSGTWIIAVWIEDFLVR